MGTNKLNEKLIHEVSQWLDNQGKDALNKVSEKKSKTEDYIKTMSAVNSELLKIPYNLL